jgi:D-3-phosphoglycerate dehydrogenase
MAVLHRNVPGVLASINHTLAGAAVNVVCQSLATRGEHGYVVSDTDVPPSAQALASLRNAPEIVHLESWN